MIQRLLAASVCAFLVVGCTKKAPPPPAAPSYTLPAAEQYQSVRSKLMEKSGALVGQVVAGPIDNLVAVEGLPLDQFPVGAVVTFIDIDQVPVGSGVVASQTSQRLQVRIVAQPGLRGPRVGDLAVRIPS